MTAKMRNLILCSMLALVLVFGTVASAQATEPVTQAKVVFQGIGAVPAGSTKTEAIAALSEAIGHDTFGATSFNMKIGPTTYKLTSSEMKSVLPSTIDYAALADLALAKQVDTTVTAKAIVFKLMPLSKRQALTRKATSLAKKASYPAKDARYTYKNSRMVVVKAVPGRSVTVSAVRAAMDQALTTYVADNNMTGAISGSTSRTITKARIYLTSKLGKCIVVDKSKRRLYLYNHGKRTTTTYRVTIGMPGHSTPSGTYIIGAKRYLPVWTNPGSDWASNMDATIGSGPNNPLGLRAMNLMRGGRDTGLRIHGTSNYGQIGTASSHGCIRVANPNIVKLYPKVPVGTKVFVQP